MAIGLYYKWGFKEAIDKEIFISKILPI